MIEILNKLELFAFKIQNLIDFLFNARISNHLDNFWRPNDVNQYIIQLLFSLSIIFKSRYKNTFAKE